MEYRIDLKEVNGPKQFQEAVRTTLPCPDYYGNNLDALYDWLTEVGEPMHIVLMGFEEMQHRMPGYAEAIEAMCTDAMAENSGLRIELQ